MAQWKLLNLFLLTGLFSILGFSRSLPFARYQLVVVSASNSGLWDYLECGVHFPLGSEYKECLSYSADEHNQHPNLFFGCLSAANGLKNAFVLVQISRFQQIIGVYTLQAPNETAKVRYNPGLVMCTGRTAVAAYLPSKHLLLFVLAEECSRRESSSWNKVGTKTNNSMIISTCQYI